MNNLSWSNCLLKSSYSTKLHEQNQYNHSDYTRMVSDQNMHLSVWQKAGLVSVCYLVFPGAPYTWRWETSYLCDWG